MFRTELVHLQGVYQFLLCKHLLNNILICFTRGETEYVWRREMM